MKAPSRHKSSLSGSFRQVSRVGLTLQLRGTAPSDEDGLFNATARDRRRGCLRCNSRENHGSDGVPFLHNAVLLSTIISLNLRGVALHRCGRAGHRSTRITCGYYRTRASQVGGRPFNAQDPEQDFHAVRGNTCQARSELCSEKQAVYCTELATEEKTLLALLPTRRIVPTTITRITASITAYSAIS